MKEKSLKLVVFGTVLVLLASGIGTVSAFSNSGGGDWSHYKEITIKENSGKTLTDYQVLVELKPANFPANAKTDGSDLRFEDESGKELNYWIEDWDFEAKEAKIWVKVPSIPANGKMKIKMYYGNPSAGAVSDGDKVFEFFDDFEDGDISDWTIVYGSATGSNGVMKVEPTSRHCAWCNHPKGDPYLTQCALLYKDNTYTGSLAVRFNFKLTYILEGENNGCTQVHFLYHDSDNEREVPLGGDSWAIYLGGDAENNAYRLDKYVDGEGVVPFGNPDIAGDTNWHTTKILRDQNGDWELYRDDLKILGGNDPWLPKISNKLYIRLPNAPATYFDNFRIRKYTSPEPTLTLSAEYATTAPTPTPPTPPEGKIKAVWLYNPDKYNTSTLMPDLKSAGINSIFLSTDVNNIWKYERFVKSAHENGIEVHAMILEDPRCALKENNESSIKAVETVLDYNDKSLAKFDGINIDTEPYVDLDLEEVWQDYITLLEAIHEKTAGKTVLSADIPRWYDEAKIKDIAPNVDFFTIMAYDSGGAGWNTASEIEDAVASEMGAIRGENSKAVIGIGVHEGFEDKGAVEKCVDNLYKYYSGDSAFSGVSIFKYESHSGLSGVPEVPTGEEKGIPGFEAVFAIVGLLAVAYLLRRRDK